VIVASRLLGGIFRRLRQPPVIGEILAGIVLGPSLLGQVAPRVSEFLLPPAVGPFLSVLAQVGVVLFMFLVGLELDIAKVRDHSKAALGISHASIVVPMLFGSILSLWVYPKVSTRDVPFHMFALFMGVAMSITAFPALARVLSDQGKQKTKIGIVAISCAAIDDVTAWCLLAFIVSMVHGRFGGAFMTIGMTILYIAVMIIVVRPIVGWVVARQESSKTVHASATAVIIVGVLLSAFLTELIGVHAVFGAFLFGAIIPHDGRLARVLTMKLEELVIVLLLPAFFAFVGMQTRIGLLTTPEHWVMCGVIILVACAGKFGGSTIAAKIAGLGWRDAASIGILMNTRGLMELVVLTIGLELRVISPTLFAMMVIMALVTTIMTAPILRLLMGEGAEDTTSALA
jgi:Kef-type K+ transport system membrane component KefB